MASQTPGPYDVRNLRTGLSHGNYDSLEEARGCVAYDRLVDWQIWRLGDELVAERDSGNYPPHGPVNPPFTCRYHKRRAAIRKARG